MNPQNYASLEASKLLEDAGILKRNPEIGDRVSVNCEGDIHEGFVVNIDKNSSDIEVRFDGCEETSWMEHWEANMLYSMAEVWRELYDCYGSISGLRRKTIMSVEGLAVAGYSIDGTFVSGHAFTSENPTEIFPAEEIIDGIA